MNRRHFLGQSAALSGLSLVPPFVFAGENDQALQQNYQRFQAALAAKPQLAVYSSVVGELAGEARVEGKLPSDLAGSFYRNGPGRFDLHGERYHHWFDGDGFVQQWRIADGKVQHIGKFVQTQKFVAESRADKFLYSAFGTHLDRASMKNSDSINAANTNVLPFNGSLYALWEGGSAIELDPSNLATRGVKSWRPDLAAMPFSAHPKIETNGMLWNFGTLPGINKLAVYQLDQTGKLQRFALLEVANLAMVHDFAISAAHLIFLIAPYDVKHRPNASFLDMHTWAGSGPQARGMRVVVISKADLSIRQIFELPAAMVFHLGNAFDDGHTTRLDACLLAEGDALQGVSAPMRGETRLANENRSFAAQIKLDYRSKQGSVTRLFGASDFPRVMPQVVAHRHRKLALLGSSKQGDAKFESVAMVDTDSGAVDQYHFGQDWQVEEHILVPRHNARSETDGYLVGVAQNLVQGNTVLSVFDAAQIAQGPLALAHLPYRAPICFHGNFLAA
jgi:all-trans-8'-apo-beta-carotenal 15,15'-oxygenase